jgi:hypothetical protein
LWVFETGSGFVAQADLKLGLVILLLQQPEGTNYKLTYKTIPHYTKLLFILMKEIIK